LSNSQILRTPRIGFGWDSHEFQPGIPLKIGGVLIPHHAGLAGHSDGDVLLHALTDALLGAIAAGDIGTYFPPTDPKWKGADSTVFVREALKQIEAAGYVVGNVDSTLILAAPKIGPHAKAIQQHVAASIPRVWGSKPRLRKAWAPTMLPSHTWPCCSARFAGRSPSCYAHCDHVK
jgi:2-C-methyl-D-erythritol 2,4-cyclodiphosphate synthase